jgi:NAD(P)-dependent dehydrogenase (short-subunit alcohol dehydrogenase family)
MHPINYGLEDKVFVVTGGSRGIGFEIAGSDFMTGQTLNVDGGASAI